MSLWLSGSWGVTGPGSGTKRMTAWPRSKSKCGCSGSVSQLHPWPLFRSTRKKPVPWIPFLLSLYNDRNTFLLKWHVRTPSRTNISPQYLFHLKTTTQKPPGIVWNPPIAGGFALPINYKGSIPRLQYSPLWSIYTTHINYFWWEVECGCLGSFHEFLIILDLLYGADLSKMFIWKTSLLGRLFTVALDNHYQKFTNSQEY